MNKYVIISSVLLIGALIFSGLLFWFISTNYEIKDTAVFEKEVEPTITKPADEVLIPTDSNPTAVKTDSVPLKDIALTPDQVETLTKVGVDVDTYVLTPDLITCFETALGKEKWQEIIAGAKPGVLDIAKLVPCVK